MGKSLGDPPSRAPKGALPIDLKRLMSLLKEIQATIYTHLILVDQKDTPHLLPTCVLETPLFDLYTKHLLAVLGVPIIFHKLVSILFLIC